jgi:hypothetical protein
MAIASFILAIVAILIALASAGYTRRQAVAAEDVREIEQARRLEERRPCLSGKVERLGSDTYQLRVTLDSNEPLQRLNGLGLGRSDHGRRVGVILAGGRSMPGS